jgi:TctA family transporter
VFADGDFTTLVTHPLSAVPLTIAIAALLLTALPEIRRQRALLG